MTRPPRPRAVFRPENIPFRLRQRARFVPWSYTWNSAKSKWDKPPRRLDGSLGSSTDPAARYAFEVVRDAIEGGMPFDGIGVVLTSADPFVAIDLDKCVDRETRRLELWAREIVLELNSYSEFSPSGCGVRIVVEGKLPPGRRRKGFIEMYDDGRYVTMTGDRIPGTLERIDPRQGELERLHRRIFGDERERVIAPAPTRPVALDDRELLVRAMRAVNGDRFSRLWSGDISAYGDDHSAADLALCSHLAFWTGRDAARIDRLFRASGLMREKWDERRGGQTYGQRTIDVAIGQTRNTFGDAA